MIKGIIITIVLCIASQASAVCRVAGMVAPRQVHRGMYVSIYASNSGQMPIARILGNTGEENALLSFITKYQFDSLSLYNLPTILSSPTLRPALLRFIDAARACGVTDVNAIGSVSRQFDQVKTYAPNKFSGLISEIEFWNAPPVSSSFNAFIAQLQYMKTISPSVTPYIGWLNNNTSLTEAQEAAKIAANTTRVFVHAYVTTPLNAYVYTKSRVKALLAAKPSLPIWPIFSAEGSAYRAGSERFMGDWLALNSLDAAESLYKRSYVPDGFQYFAYEFLRKYLK